MAYKELIKNIQSHSQLHAGILCLWFQKREEYTRKSPRSYDNERRRIESILGDYMQFHQTENGKNVFYPSTAGPQNIIHCIRLGR